jgi:hypothetical protein
MTKTLNRMSKVSYCPDMRREVVAFVRKCQDCQRAKQAQDSEVRFRSSEVVTRPLERIFIDFVGPIVRSRTGNVAVLDGFSKFVCMYPVRRISSEVVKNCLQEKFSPEPVWTIWRSENSYPHRDLNPDPSVVQPIARRYTDWALSASRPTPTPKHGGDWGLPFIWLPLLNFPSLSGPTRRLLRFWTIYLTN